MNLIQSYNQLVEAGKIENDVRQKEIFYELEKLYKNLLEQKNKRSGIASFFLKKKEDRDYEYQGVYIHGDVGRGKSMLMDLFYEVVSKEIPSSRVHFHSFMIQVHENLNHLRKSKNKKDYVRLVCQEIATECKILCLDELQISDIADAMIVGRIFNELLTLGVNVITTSNREPDELYKNGLQRQRFEPFINLIKQEMQILNLDSDTDYRLRHIQNLAETYHYPLGREAEKFIEEAFFEFSGGHDTHEEIIKVKGRSIKVSKVYLDVAQFDFAELCDKPLGSEDYLEITLKYKTLIITNIPKMGKDDYNLAIRFTKLVDALYEAKTNLICTAEVPPFELYKEGERSFEFNRTVSRLIEMQSDEYISKVA